MTTFRVRAPYQLASRLTELVVIAKGAMLTVRQLPGEICEIQNRGSITQAPSQEVDQELRNVFKKYEVEVIEELSEPT